MKILRKTFSSAKKYVNLAKKAPEMIKPRHYRAALEATVEQTERLRDISDRAMKRFGEKRLVNATNKRIEDLRRLRNIAYPSKGISSANQVLKEGDQIIKAKEAIKKL